MTRTVLVYLTTLDRNTLADGGIAVSSIATATGLPLVGVKEAVDALVLDGHIYHTDEDQ
jgi:hypothetical protein